MADKLTPRGRAKLATLEEVIRDVQHIHNLTEQFAASRHGQQQIGMALKRAWRRLKIRLMGVGFEQMSQMAGSMEIAAGRGGSVMTKTRILREGVGSLLFQLELEQRTVRRDETVPIHGGSAGDDD